MTRHEYSVAKRAYKISRGGEKQRAHRKLVLTVAEDMGLKPKQMKLKFKHCVLTGMSA